MEAIRRLGEARDAQGRRVRDRRDRTATERRAATGAAVCSQSSYVNFYLPNGGVVMPAFDDPHDERARDTDRRLFSGRDILQIDALDIVEGGGGIHCITQQEPR